MNKKQLYLYHCSHCGELFQAPISRRRKVCCVHCGNSPVPSRKSASSVHGVPGGDPADFVAVRKRKRKKQLSASVKVWILLLAMCLAGALYYKKSQAVVVENVSQRHVETEALSEEVKKSQFDAVSQCSALLNLFTKLHDNYERSEFVFDGVSKILKMNDYYERHGKLQISGDLVVSNASFEMVEGQPVRVNMLLRDKAGMEIEAVFHLQEDQWKLDWEHFVRYSTRSWNSFNLQRIVGSDGEFRVYVRRRHQLAGDDQQRDFEVLFYEPRLASGGRGLESPQLTLAADNPNAKRFAEAFDSLQKRVVKDGDGTKFDEAGMLRVRVKLAFEKGEKGGGHLVLKELCAFNWLDEKVAKQEEHVSGN